MPIRTEQITDTCLYGTGRKPQEFYKEVFENIGDYIKDNAERYSENIVDTHAGMKIIVDLPIQGIVELQTVVNEYVLNKNVRGK